MNNPTSTILEFATRPEEPSFITPPHTLHPRSACAKLASPPPELPFPTSLSSLIQQITKTLSKSRLPLDPSLPLLQTPDNVPLKPVRPRSDIAPLLPERLPEEAPWPPFLSAQAEHLQRVSHYNYHVLELTARKSVTYPAAAFCEELISLLPESQAFKQRFGVFPTSKEAVALISALKTSREVVVPIHDKVFLHARGGGEKLRTRNGQTLEQILSSICVDGDGIWYRRFRASTMFAWTLVLVCLVLIAAMGVYNPARRDSVFEVVLDCANVVGLVLLVLVAGLGAGRELRSRFRVLFGWRAWGDENDVTRDVGPEGRDCLVNELLSGDKVDVIMNAFGLGRGEVRLKEWSYDPRVGVIIGERFAFCVRGRLWYRVEKEEGGGQGVGKKFRYKLMPTETRKAFVGVGVGVAVIDGTNEKEVV